MNIYLTTVFAWAGVVVSVCVLVWACSTVYQWARLHWLWRDDPRPGYVVFDTRDCPQSRPTVSSFGAAGASLPPVGRAGTTAASSADAPYDWSKDAA